MGRRNSGTLEKQGGSTSQGARRSPQAAASDTWNTLPDESQTATGHRKRVRADAGDGPSSSSSRATKMQPRVRAAVSDPETSNPRRATGAPSSSGRGRGSRYSLPGQSGIMYRGPAEDDETLPALASPEISGTQPGISSTRRRTTVGPAPNASTSSQPAISPEEDSARATGRRRITSARPVTAEDRALVAASTQVLQAIDVVQDDVVAATTNLPAVRDDMSVLPIEETETAVVPVTVVPATLAPADWLTHRPRHRSRSLVSGIVTFVVSLVLIFSVLQAVSPVGAAPGQLPSFTLVTGQLGSDNPGHAPTGPWDTSSGAADTLGLGGGAAPGTNAPGSAGLPATGKPSNSGSNKAGPSTTISPAPLHPWPPYNQFKVYPPGYSSYAVQEPANDYYYWAFGQCTWWAQWKRGDENLRHMGNAQYWASSAKARGYRVGSTPAVNATVVFQPGVQGAGGAGHVAHVVKVYPGGWFLISEMNFYWNGGGWGRVDYRYAHSGSGVSFIY